MPNFRIFPLSPTDWQRYREIRLEAVKTEPSAFSLTYADALQRTPAEWQERVASFMRGEKSWLLVAQPCDAVAQAGDRLVGMLGAYPAGQDSAEIVQVYVSPDWRGKRVGEALMEAILAALAQDGIQTTDLGVYAEQRAAVGLYKKLGFQVIEETEGVRGTGERYSAYRMRKELKRLVHG